MNCRDMINFRQQTLGYTNQPKNTEEAEGSLYNTKEYEYW